MPRRAAFLVTLFIAVAARAEMPTDLALPLDCAARREIAGSCATSTTIRVRARRTTRAARLTGDGHKGTDFAIRDLAAMVEGVQVRAAAAGVVDALRDGVPDISVEEARPRGDRRQGMRQRHPDRPRRRLDHLVLPPPPRQPDGRQRRPGRGRPAARLWSASPARPAFPTSTSTSGRASRWSIRSSARARGHAAPDRSLCGAPTSWRGSPTSRWSGAAWVRALDADERIDRLLALADVEVEVGKARLAREADQSERLAEPQPVAWATGCQACRT